jgi:hypothetical protein
VLRQSHMGSARHSPLSQTGPKSQKRGRIRSLPLFYWPKNLSRSFNSTWLSPRLFSPPSFPPFPASHRHP